MQVHRAKDDLSARGAELVLVGNGEPRFIAAFREDTGVDAPIYTDPTLASYRALELRRSVVATLFSGRALTHALRALRAGFRQRGVQGDAFQLGGVVVIRPDGEIVYRYASREAGDHPPIEDVLASITQDPVAALKPEA